MARLNILYLIYITLQPDIVEYDFKSTTNWSILILLIYINPKFSHGFPKTISQFDPAFYIYEVKAFTI